mgnify:CR=1 FL=1
MRSVTGTTGHLRDGSLPASLPPIVSWGSSPEDVISVQGVVPNPDDITDENKRTSKWRALDYMGLKPGTPITDIRLDRVVKFVKDGKDPEDEKHPHALQLDVIERCVTLWSNPGETVATPGAGKTAFALRIAGELLSERVVDQMAEALLFGEHAQQHVLDLAHALLEGAVGVHQLDHRFDVFVPGCQYFGVALAQWDLPITGLGPFGQRHLVVDFEKSLVRWS